MAKTVSDPLARFPKADAAVKNRIIAGSYGFPGCGKTAWWLGAPGPIVLLSFNKGYEGVIEQFQDLKDIRVVDYDWVYNPDAEGMQDDAEAIITQFYSDYELAIQHARTVIVDLESELWEVARYAEFGAPADNPRNFDKLNSRMRRLVNMAKATDVNLGMLQAMKERYNKQTNKNTGAKGFAASGEFERWGFKELEGLVHQNIEHRRVKVDGGQTRFEIEVGKARGPGSRDVQDQTFEVKDPKMGFMEFALQLFPDSDVSNWE